MVLVNDKPIVSGVFPNNEKYYYIQPAQDCFIFKLIFENNEDIFDLLMYKKYIDDKYPVARTILELFFCPYGQSDREFDNKIFTFKYFAKLINEANFNCVQIFDPHSPVIAATIDRCIIHYPRHKVALNEYDLIFYPDNGAEKKYSEIYKFPHRFGNKKRNLDTGEIICYEVIADKEDIENKKILIRDDLIVRGGTFKYAAKALKELGAKQVDLFVTHTFDTAKDFYEHLSDNYIDNFYTLNTLNIKWLKPESIV